MKDYYIKTDKKEFLYPKHWKLFESKLTEKQLPYFKIVIETGGRINEILHVTPNDIDEDKKILFFRITKVRARKKETRPEPRRIAISSNLINWLKRYQKRNNIKPNQPFVSLSKSGIRKIIKIKLKQVKEETGERINWKDISSHNLRKTHGNWLKAVGVDGTEIATRLGHDMNTMLRHYVSANLFNVEDKILITDILSEELVNRLRGSKQ